MISTKGLLAAAVVAAGMTGGAAQADVGVGIAVSWVFGSVSGGSGPAIGFKVFSSRERDRAAGSVGLDYLFQSGALRPTIGLAYISNHVFADLNLGYNLKLNAIDAGIAIGGVNSETPPPPAGSPTPPPGGGGGTGGGETGGEG